jgi:hypothetical protein
MANELFLRIRTDSRGNPVSLDNIPVEAIDVLTVFLESLSEIAKAQPNKDEVKFSLRNSSVGIALEYPEAETEIDEKIDDVIEGRSLNNEYYKALRNIQDKVKANGLTYEIVHTVNDVSRNLTEEFKSKNFVRRLGARKEKTDSVVFLKGNLFESGGKRSTNIHLAVGADDFKIECTQDQARRLNKLLYEDIRLCVLKKTVHGASPTYTLLDSYVSDKTYSLFKEFYESIDNNSIERFEILVNKLIQAFEQPAMPGEIVKLMRLFNYPQADRGNLRAILVTLKPVRDHERVVSLYKSLADYLRAGSTHKVI